MNSDDSPPVYIIDHYCAERLRGILEQLLDVFNETLARRRFDPPGPNDFGPETADMLANVGGLKMGLLDEDF